MKLSKAIISTLLLSFLSCCTSLPLTVQDNTTSSPRTWHASSVFISDCRIATLKRRVLRRAEPTYSAFTVLHKIAEVNYLSRKPSVPTIWYVPRFYEDAQGHKKAKNGLRDDANAAYALALCYRITDDQKYAKSAIRIINAWVSGVKRMSRIDDSMLSFSFHFPAMIFAADLLRDSTVWPKEQQIEFSTFLKKKVLPMNTMWQENNHGNWGLVLAIACATYLDDERLFNKCIKRWKSFIKHQIAHDGHLPHEVRRSDGRRGIWYSHFCLMPQTIAAEIAKVNGVDLYDYKSRRGRTLKDAFVRIAEWSRNPKTFPYWKGSQWSLRGVDYYSYFEILNAHWRNDAASELLMRFRPMTARHSAPFLTFTHGEPLYASGK